MCTVCVCGGERENSLSAASAGAQAGVHGARVRVSREYWW